MKQDAFREFLKYGLVGLINTLLSLTVIFVLIKGFKVSYMIANAVGYGFGLINSFILNKKWTFRSNGTIVREGMGFIIVFGICYLMQLGALTLMIEKLNISREFATLAAMVLYMGLNFIGNKWIAFRKKVE